MDRTKRYLALKNFKNSSSNLDYIHGRIRGIIAAVTNELEHKPYPTMTLNTEGKLGYENDRDKVDCWIIKFLATDEELELVKKHIFNNDFYRKIVDILEWN